jgi:Cu(I)/Ag(I) efflux system membrane protein CusA/SilA
MKKFAMLTTALLISVAGPVLAQSMQMPMKAATPVSAASASAMPLVDGEIRKLDPATGLVVLKHDDIPNLAMPAMTMGYVVADRKMLEGVKVGDKVRFQAEMVNGKATVTELKAVK